MPPTPSSPSVWTRRKDKATPTLNLTSITPPNTGTSDRFPFPPSPSAVSPGLVIDANVVATTDDLTQWKAEAGELNLKINAVVLALSQDKAKEIAERQAD